MLALAAMENLMMMMEMMIMVGHNFTQIAIKL